MFKVAGKMFALSALGADELKISLKCDPGLAEQLRDAYEAIGPGYHLNKRHWNTVVVDGVDRQLLVRHDRGQLRPGGGEAAAQDARAAGLERGGLAPAPSPVRHDRYVALGDREYRAVLDLVGEVHDAGGVTEMRALVLPALRGMVAAEYASYNEVGPDHALVSIADPELPDWAYEAWGRHWAQNPLVQRHAHTRDSRPYQWTDIVDPAEFRRTELFDELYRPLGIDHQISFVLPSPADLTIGLALSRGGSRFSEPEREMLDLARPHLIQAYRNAQIKDALSALLDDVRRGVDAAGQGVVVVAAERARLVRQRQGRRPRGALVRR